MSKWIVVSREYSYVEPVLDDGSGPTHYTCDVVEVDAENKKEARIAALKELRKLTRGFIYETNGENPFGGMKIFLKEGLNE